MNFIVAGIMLVLACVIGAVSCAIIPYYETKTNNEDKKAELRLSAATIFEACRRERNYIFLSFAVLLCAVSGFVSVSATEDLIGIIRYNSVLLILMSAMIIDRKTHLLPNVLTGSLMAVGAILLVFELIFFRESFKNVLFAGLIGFFVCFAVFWLLAKLTKEGVGMGDVKLIGAMGWTLGLEQTLAAVLFALVLCSVTALILIFAKRKNKNDSVPFGPFLFFGYTVLIISMGF